MNLKNNSETSRVLRQRNGGAGEYRSIAFASQRGLHNEGSADGEIESGVERRLPADDLNVTDEVVYSLHCRSSCRTLYKNKTTNNETFVSRISNASDDARLKQANGTLACVQRWEWRNSYQGTRSTSNLMCAKYLPGDKRHVLDATISLKAYLCCR